MGGDSLPIGPVVPPRHFRTVVVRFETRDAAHYASGTEDASFSHYGGFVMKKLVVFGAILLTLALALDAQARPRCRRCRGGGCCAVSVENVNETAESMIGGK